MGDIILYAIIGIILAVTPYLIFKLFIKSVDFFSTKPQDSSFFWYYKFSFEDNYWTFAVRLILLVLTLIILIGTPLMFGYWIWTDYQDLVLISIYYIYVFFTSSTFWWIVIIIAAYYFISKWYENYEERKLSDLEHKRKLESNQYHLIDKISGLEDEVKKLKNKKKGKKKGK